MTNRLRTSSALWAAVGAIGLAIVWETFVRVRDVRPFVLLPPSRIATTFAETPRFYVRNIGVTALHMVIGIVIALFIAVAAGALMAAYRPLEHASQPMLVLMLVTPWVAYISSIVLWLGTGAPSIIFLVTFVTVPAFTYAAVAGMRGADPASRELFRSIDASRREVFWRLRLPSALPAIFTAARFNVGLGLAAAYFAEGAALSRDGLGEAGKRAAALNAGAVLWTTIMCAAALGIAGQVAVALLERWLLRWHVSQRPQL